MEKLKKLIKIIFSFLKSIIEKSISSTKGGTKFIATNYKKYGLLKTVKLSYQKLNKKVAIIFGKHYYCVQQHDMTDCAAACLATISKQYGLDLPIAKIRQIAGTDKKGTNALGVIKAAENLGFEAKGVRATPEDLQTEDIEFPIIAHVVKDGLLHYVVVHEVKSDKIIVADPAPSEGLVKYEPEDFYEIWSGVLILLTPGVDFETGSEKVGFFKRFLKLLKPHKALLFEIFLASILYSLLGILASFYFRHLIDDILVDYLETTLHVFSVGVIFLTFFQVILNFFRQHLLLYLSQKIDVSLILNYYRHVVNLPMNFFDTRKVGSILSRLSDATRIRQAVSGATITVLVDTLLIIISGVVLYLQNAKLFLIALIFVPIYAVVVWSFNKPLRTVHRKEMEDKAELEAYLVESISGAATVKSFNAEREVNLETESRFIKMIKRIFHATWLSNIQSALEGLLSGAGKYIILWIGGLEVLEGNISIGQLIAFNAILGYFLDPMEELIDLQPQLQEAYVAGDRLAEILDLESEKKYEDEKIKIDRIKGEVEIKDLNFRYGTREKVLDDINLDVKSGEKVALVGETGAGKSTLVKLLLKYYTADEGKILIDGTDIRDISTKSLRARIGYVPQDIFLFSGTIKENITFGAQDIDMAKVVDAAKKAKLHEFIDEQPLRYNTLVGEHGTGLSGGQKQRLALARVLLKEPEMLILDEATSNLDTITEKAIYETINSISNDLNLTTFIIAHRLGTIMHCDTIVVMKEGEIIEKGGHQELIDRKGAYYDLWQGQIYKEDN